MEKSAYELYLEEKVKMLERKVQSLESLLRDDRLMPSCFPPKLVSISPPSLSDLHICLPLYAEAKALLSSVDGIHLVGWSKSETPEEKRYSVSYFLKRPSIAVDRLEAIRTMDYLYQSLQRAMVEDIKKELERIKG